MQRPARQAYCSRRTLAREGITTTGCPPLTAPPLLAMFATENHRPSLVIVRRLSVACVPFAFPPEISAVEVFS